MDPTVTHMLMYIVNKDEANATWFLIQIRRCTNAYTSWTLNRKISPKSVHSPSLLILQSRDLCDILNSHILSKAHWAQNPTCRLMKSSESSQDSSATRLDGLISARRRAISDLFSPATAKMSAIISHVDEGAEKGSSRETILWKNFNVKFFLCKIHAILVNWSATINLTTSSKDSQKVVVRTCESVRQSPYGPVVGQNRNKMEAWLVGWATC